MSSSEELRDNFRYLFPAELKRIKHFCRELPANPLVINIGAGAGTSGLAMLESRDDLHVYTIDIQLEDSPFGCLYAEFVAAEKAGLSDRLHQIHGDSVVVGLAWMEEEPFVHPDLVFIDGDHSYDGCAADIQVWLSQLKIGGYMLVHDYDKGSVKFNENNHPHPKVLPGVDRAVRELRKSKSVRFIERVDTMMVFRKVK